MRKNLVSDAKFWRIQLTKESKSNLLGATMLLI